MKKVILFFMHPEFTSFDFIGQAGSKADFLKKREEKVFSIVENGREAQGDIKDKFRQDLESVIKEGAMDKDFIESLIGHFQIEQPRSARQSRRQGSHPLQRCQDYSRGIQRPGRSDARSER